MKTSRPGESKTNKSPSAAQRSITPSLKRFTDLLNSIPYVNPKSVANHKENNKIDSRSTRRLSPLKYSNIAMETPKNIKTMLTPTAKTEESIGRAPPKYSLSPTQAKMTPTTPNLVRDFLGSTLSPIERKITFPQKTYSADTPTKVSFFIKQPSSSQQIALHRLETYLSTLGYSWSSNANKYVLTSQKKRESSGKTTTILSESQIQLLNDLAEKSSLKPFLTFITLLKKQMHSPNVLSINQAEDTYIAFQEARETIKKFSDTSIKKSRQKLIKEIATLCCAQCEEILAKAMSAKNVSGQTLNTLKEKFTRIKKQFTPVPTIEINLRSPTPGT